MVRLKCMIFHFKVLLSRLFVENWARIGENVQCCADTCTELFYTEANHVRNLRVLQKVFYQPMSKQKYPDRLLEYVFPNLDDVHRLHGTMTA